MDDSPLRKLSPELRNTIAEMALFHSADMVIYGKPPCRYRLGFAQTCRELHQDYTQLFFSVNSFVLCTSNGKMISSIRDFENCIGPSNTQALGSIAVQLNQNLFRRRSRHITVAIENLLTEQDDTHFLRVSELRLSIVVGPYCRVFRDYLISLKDARKSLREALSSANTELQILGAQNRVEDYDTIVRLGIITAQLRRVRRKLEATTRWG